MINNGRRPLFRVEGLHENLLFGQEVQAASAMSGFAQPVPAVGIRSPISALALAAQMQAVATISAMARRISRSVPRQPKDPRRAAARFMRGCPL